MKNFYSSSLIFAALLLIASFSSVKAQNNLPPTDLPNQKPDVQARPNLMAQLGLTQDQIKQIRRINQERKQQTRAAQDRLREANRNLDQAIYADVADDVEIQTRIKEVQAAHAEVIKIRSLTELAVRRILTPEQLAKFRDVRQKFMEKKEDVQEKVKNRQIIAPNRPLNNRLNVPR